MGNDSAYDVGDEYNNYVASPCEVEGINMLGSTASEDAPAEEAKSDNEAAADEKTGNEVEVEVNASSDADVVQTAEVPAKTDSADNSNKNNTALVIVGVVALVVAATGGAVWSKKRKISLK